MRQWRLIYDHPAESACITGAYNMAVDDAILDSVAAGDSPPTIRVYTWSPPCLSLGYGQNAADADLDRIADRGWQIVRRPTGGKAILHTNELTYSLALPDQHPIAAGDIIESYRRISQALLFALEQLGADPHSERRSSSQPIQRPGAVCFEVPSHYEITVGGRKLVGSAQMRRKGGLLQHGSLPLYGDLAQICETLVYPDENTREQAKIHVRERALTLYEALGRVVDWEEASQALLEAFQTVFDLDIRQGSLTDSETERVQQLAEQRYATLERVRAKT
jgi:lipoate-protein ligase A